MNTKDQGAKFQTASLILQTARLLVGLTRYSRTRNKTSRKLRTIRKHPDIHSHPDYASTFSK